MRKRIITPDQQDAAPDEQGWLDTVYVKNWGLRD